MKMTFCQCFMSLIRIPLLVRCTDTTVCDMRQVGFPWDTLGSNYRIYNTNNHDISTRNTNLKIEWHCKAYLLTPGAHLQGFT